MPGVLTLEALAQASIILFKKSFDTLANKGSVFLLGSVRASFSKPIFPGDQIILEINIDKVISNGAIVQGIAKVGDNTVAKATLTFGTVERDALV
jgi:3-hydroxyacyl-[acyl-carrier-protein] dehydratase